MQLKTKVEEQRRLFDAQDRGEQNLLPAAQTQRAVLSSFEHINDGVEWLTRRSKSRNTTTVIRILENPDLNDGVRDDAQLRALLPSSTWTLQDLVNFNPHFAPLVLCIVDRWQTMTSQVNTFDRDQLTMEDTGQHILARVPAQELALFATQAKENGSVTLKI